MKPSRLLLTGALIAVVLSTATFVAGSRLGGSDEPDAFDVVTETFRELRERAATPVSDEELARAAVRGMLEALGDPYASSLSPRQLREVRELLRDTIIGIGVWLETAEEGLHVTWVVEGSPAESSGLREGDVIVRVDGHPMRGRTVEEAARFVRGPEGSVVELLVLRDGRRLTVAVTRARIEMTDVQARMLPGRVAYAHLLRFGTGATEDLRRALTRLLREGARGIVLDLRGNTGGLAEEAVGVAGLFLDGGAVAILQERDRPDRELRAASGPLPAVPLVVLVDGGTASAAELVAAAVQERGRGMLVGTRTFGKGSVLTVVDVDPATKIQYTTGFILTPAGRPIEGRGVVPDVVAPLGDGEDAQLDRALEVLGRP